MAGINYYLDRLPRGYQVMDYPKIGDESVVGLNLYLPKRSLLTHA
jgi:hypothetical protein